MEIIYYTVAAIILYVVSDYILNSIEIRVGRRFEYRSLYFLVIILVLSLASFSAIRTLLVESDSPQQSTDIPASPANGAQGKGQNE